ncbi:hypothetical protein BXZ70DRAFT_784236 [Cristinia sonorae]|uniref:DUF6697 domain-containing protein n=1 Tax=Cristinia sonorae TaxID=1940300 RepID=A0A8K0USL1_9AGAR|nr:hypothetical protein BXZ70DRAFT_784236 [Cristinia sonorae]
MDPFCLVLLHKLSSIGEDNIRLEGERAKLVKENEELRGQAEFDAMTNDESSPASEELVKAATSGLNEQIKELHEQLNEKDAQLAALQSQVQQVELDRTTLQRHLENERNTVLHLQSTTSSEINALHEQLAECRKDLYQKTSEFNAVVERNDELQAQLAAKILLDRECQTEVVAKDQHQPSSSLLPSLVQALDNVTRPVSQVDADTNSASGLRIRLAPPNPRRRTTATTSTKGYVSNLPQARKDMLAKFPLVHVDLDDATLLGGFLRPHLGKYLGGGSQSLIANIDRTKEQTTIAMKHDVTALLYPKRDLNCWLPASPGQHGFMFVGLAGPAKENERFAEAEVRTLFIQQPRGEWQYFGHYEVQRDPDDDLTVDEWQSLTQEFREGYVACTLSKRMGNAKCDDFRKKDPSRYKVELEKIAADYDAGTLRVPCVTLWCIKFDAGLVSALAQAASSSATTSSSRATKRKHEEAESISAPSASAVKRARDSPHFGDLFSTNAPEASGSVRKSNRIQSRGLPETHHGGENAGRESMSSEFKYVHYSV